jgi:hypothetical protein
MKYLKKYRLFESVNGFIIKVGSKVDYVNSYEIQV